MLTIIEREHPKVAIEAALRERLGRLVCAALGVPYIAGATMSAWTVYGSFIEKLGNKLIDLDTDTFKALLVTSAYTPNAGTHDELADVSANQAANSSTVTITSPAWTRSGATSTWDVADITFTASGGTATARYVVIYDDTPTGDPLVCYATLDNTPADVSIANGDSLVIQINASGVLTAA